MNEEQRAAAAFLADRLAALPTKGEAPLPKRRADALYARALQKAQQAPAAPAQQADMPLPAADMRAPAADMPAPAAGAPAQDAPALRLAPRRKARRLALAAAAALAVVCAGTLALCLQRGGRRLAVTNDCAPQETLSVASDTAAEGAVEESLHTAGEEDGPLVYSVRPPEGGSADALPQEGEDTAPDAAAMCEVLVRVLPPQVQAVSFTPVQLGDQMTFLLDEATYTLTVRLSDAAPPAENAAADGLVAVWRTADGYCWMLQTADAADAAFLQVYTAITDVVPPQPEDAADAKEAPSTAPAEDAADAGGGSGAGDASDAEDAAGADR